MTDDVAVVADARPSGTRPAWWWMPYVYLLRAHLLTVVVLVVLPVYGRTSPLLNGLFDLDSAIPWRTVLGMALVTLAALTTALTVLATTWSTVHNAPQRFGVAPIRVVDRRRVQRFVWWIAEPARRFIEPDTTTLRDGHLLAWVAFCESAFLYAVIGVSLRLEKMKSANGAAYRKALACPRVRLSE
jgi:hypothetical protein